MTDTKETQENQAPEHDFDHDLLLDHEYDGIKEYDNPLPGWWVWCFAITIIFCVPYTMWYHFGKGLSIWDKYDNEVTAYNESIFARYGTLEADQETILRFMNDDDALRSAESIFKGKCAQCHLADGSGDVGPNLTDTSWLSVKQITDIPRIITKGLPDKEMPEWGSKLTQTEIVLLSSYVAQLQNHPVAGKVAEGESIPPWDEPSN